jgi:hypothetical protein
LTSSGSRGRGLGRVRHRDSGWREVRGPGRAGGADRASGAQPVQAAGTYVTSTAIHGFVVSAINGSWRRAQRVPPLKKGSTDEVLSVSCVSAASCVVGRDYIGQALFVMTSRNGVWRTPLPLRSSSGHGSGQNSRVSEPPGPDFLRLAKRCSTFAFLATTPPSPRPLVVRPRLSEDHHRPRAHGPALLARRSTSRTSAAGRPDPRCHH